MTTPHSQQSTSGSQRNSRQRSAHSTAINRRSFLRDAGTIAAGLAASQMVLPRRSWAAPAPNEAIGLGLIGCGRRGMQLLRAALDKPGVGFSIVCDVNIQRATAAAELAAQLSGVQPAITTDYRDVLDDSQVHGVFIATPVHWHTSILISACAAQKDVYVEVPLALTPIEITAMAYAVNKYKRVVQVGLQQRSASAFNEAQGIVRSGRLGTIAQTRSWNFTRQSPIARVSDGPVPTDFDYDRWLGPAPERPFNANRVGRPEHFWDYGSGEAALWNVQQMDLINMTMRVSVPVSVVAVGGNHGLKDDRETPDTLDAIFEYAVPSARFTHVYSMRLSNAYAGWGPAALPPANESPDAMPLDLPSRSGTQFFGTEKTLFVGGKKLLLLPAEAESPVEDLSYLGICSQSSLSPSIESQPASTPGPRVDSLTIAHVQQFINCIPVRKHPSATIDMGELAMFPMIAATIAYRVGRKLYIEPGKREFYLDAELKTPDQEANQLLKPKYRETYQLPNV